MRQLFPAYYEMIFLLCCSTFARYANQERAQKRPGEAGPGVTLEFKSEDVIHGSRSTLLSESADEATGGEDSFPSRASQLRNNHQDDTMRGMVYRVLAQIYSALRVLLGKATKHATIHSTKLSLLTLFSVTAFQPNIFNGILFIMFLLLSMANNS